MKTETINILIQSKGRMAPHVEKVFKNNKLKIIKQSERSLIGKVKGYPSLNILFMTPLFLSGPCTPDILKVIPFNLLFKQFIFKSFSAYILLAPYKLLG